MKKIFGLLFLSLFAFSQMKKQEDKILNLEYFITETNGPDSFDPLDADKTQNITVMRMAYLTPLEVDGNNKLSSIVLSSFNYDSASKKIEFIVRSGLRFANGIPITAEDVGIAIARMSYFRPDFPVIKDIVGVNEWAKSKNGLFELPPGIRIEGSKVTISLTRSLYNPLFRFCLELFSIIPKNCIDLANGKLNCSRPAESGRFRIAENGKMETFFERRDLGIEIETGNSFDSIKFKYRALRDVCSKNLVPNQIVSGSEIELLTSNCNVANLGQQLHWLPSTRFAIIRFNPSEDLFSSRENRIFFSDLVRNELAKNKDLQVEKSLIPKLVPGFLASDKLSAPTIDRSNHFEGKRIRLAYFENASFKFIYDAYIEVARSLKMNVQVVENLQSADLLEQFLTGNIAIIAGGSGFWAQDPVGDIVMWLTPNLHKTLTFVWDDKEMYKKVADFEYETDGELLRSKLEKFNQYIVNQSLISPVLHYRRFFICSENIARLNVPQAITSPAPWQLLPVK